MGSVEHVRRAPAASFLIAVLLALALPACGSAERSPRPVASAEDGTGGLALKKIGQFDHPVYVTGAPGFPKLLFVVEQPGRVAVLRGGHRLAHPFLDLRGSVGFDGAERGMLSIAFPPDYATSGSFYVYYNDKAGNIRIDEFKRASPTRAAPGSQREVIGIPHPENANHNGGQMQFLGNLLYFGTGDGGSAGDPPNNAQNKEVLLGKLVRIDPRPSGAQPYSVPPSNPFVGKPGRDEIYSYGLRNPFRFSFDTVSAKQPRIAIADVGQNKFEELDYTTVAAASGANFGWDAFEGFAPYREENSGTAGSRRDHQTDLRLPPLPRRRQLLDHRRLCRRRPPLAVSLQALHLRRPLRGTAAQPGATPEARRRRPQARPRGRLPHLLRRRRCPPRLRLLVGRPGVPPRPALNPGFSPAVAPGRLQLADQPRVDEGSTQWRAVPPRRAPRRTAR